MSKAKEWMKRVASICKVAADKYEAATNKAESYIMKKCGSERMMDDVVDESIERGISKSKEVVSSAKERCVPMVSKVKDACVSAAKKTVDATTRVVRPTKKEASAPTVEENLHRSETLRALLKEITSKRTIN